MHYKQLYTALTLLGLFGALTSGCGDDEPATQPDAGMMTADTGGTVPSDGGTMTMADGGVEADAGLPSGPRFVFGATIQGDPTIAVVKFFDEFPSGQVTFEDAVELGPTFPYFIAGRIFTLDRAGGTVVRYRFDGDDLVEDGRISFSARGGAEDLFVLSDTRAFAFNSAGLEYIEFDPTAATMSIVKTIDISGVASTPLGPPSLFRRKFVRQSDNTVFSVLNYPITGTPLSVDSFFLSAVNLDSGDLTLIRDDRCPTSVSFGLSSGFFDANDDLFILADANLGLNAVFGVPNAKDPCVVRVARDTLDVDTSYQILPRTETSGRFAVGLIHLGNGLAFTSTYDTSGISPDNAIDAFLAAQGNYWLVDTASASMSRLDGIPEDDLIVFGFDVDGRNYVVRDEVVMRDGLEVPENVVLEFDVGAGTATEVFRAGGFPWFLHRIP